MRGNNECGGNVGRAPTHLRKRDEGWCSDHWLEELSGESCRLSRWRRNRWRRNKIGEVGIKCCVSALVEDCVLLNVFETIRTAAAAAAVSEVTSTFKLSCWVRTLGIELQSQSLEERRHGSHQCKKRQRNNHVEWFNRVMNQALWKHRGGIVSYLKEKEDGYLREQESLWESCRSTKVRPHFDACSHPASGRMGWMSCSWPFLLMALHCFRICNIFSLCSSLSSVQGKGTSAHLNTPALPLPIYSLSHPS